MQFESAEEQEAFLSKADHLHKWSGEYQYENLLLDVLQNGVPSNDRTGVGTIIVPDESAVKLNDAAIYARVYDPSKRKTQLPDQQKRMEKWAVTNGYRVFASVAEVGSGLNDKRRRLTSFRIAVFGLLLFERKQNGGDDAKDDEKIIHAITEPS